MSSPAMSAASGASGSGTNMMFMPICLASEAIGSTPLVWRTPPSRDNSPTNKEWSMSACICSVAASKPMAIGRS